MLPAGPVGPRNLLMVSAWWLLREIEASAVRACHAVISDGTPPVATVTLTTSKMDPEARGVGRSHACICGRSTPRPDCPVHALWDQLLVLRQRFPGKHDGSTPHEDLLLFPTAAGAAITKAAFVAVVLEGAMKTDQPQSNADGTLRLTGHSMRATGAQHLARLGTDLLGIQLLGRWGSATVLDYVRDAATGVEAARARARPLGATLRDLTTAAAQADLPTAGGAEFQGQVESWFSGWYAERCPTRASMVAEVTELLERRAAAGRASRGSSTSSSSSSTSSSPAPPAEDAQRERAGPAAPEPAEEVPVEPAAPEPTDVVLEGLSEPIVCASSSESVIFTVGRQ